MNRQNSVTLIGAAILILLLGTTLAVKDIWGPWTQWSDCTASCGTGFQSRSRLCFGGKLCVGPEKDRKICDNRPCPVDGNWGPWTHFSACSVSCDTGTKFRSRKCNSPAPQGGGKDCHGKGTHTTRCKEGPCSAACGGRYTHEKDGICYAYVSDYKERKNWSAAQSYCRSIGGYLAEILTEEQNNFVKGIFKHDMIKNPVKNPAHWKCGNDFGNALCLNMWLGGSDLRSEGKWRWSASNTLFSSSGFTYWGRDSSGNPEPNNVGHDEHCLQFSARTMEWNDARCSELNRFLCQKGMETWEVVTRTGYRTKDRPFPGTKNDIRLQIQGSKRNSRLLMITDSLREGATQTFTFNNVVDVGKVNSLRVEQLGSDGWFLLSITLTSSSRVENFNFHGWVDIVEPGQKDPTATLYPSVDGQWGAWGPWGACSTTCGLGIKSCCNVGLRERSRHCDNPPPSRGGLPCDADGSLIQKLEEACNNLDCK